MEFARLSTPPPPPLAAFYKGFMTMILIRGTNTTDWPLLVDNWLPHVLVFRHWDEQNKSSPTLHYSLVFVFHYESVRFNS